MLQALHYFMPLAEAIVHRKWALPILSHICVRNEHIYASNLDSILITPVADRRAYTLPFELLKRIYHSHPKTLKIRLLKGRRLRLQFDKQQLECQGKDPGDFPELPGQRFREIGRWPAALLQSLLQQVCHCSRDELKPNLQGIWFSQTAAGFGACATDAHTLDYRKYRPAESEKNFKMDSDFTGVLPVGCLNIMSKIPLTWLGVGVSERFFRFSLPHYSSLFVRRKEQNFPDFKAVLELDRPHRVRLERAALLRAVARGMHYANPVTQLGILTLGRGKITLQSSDPERELIYQTSLTMGDRHGPELRIGLNLELLRRTLASLPVEQLYWHYRDSVSAVLFTGVDGELQRNLLMPVRLEED